MLARIGGGPARCSDSGEARKGVGTGEYDKHLLAGRSSPPQAIRAELIRDDNCHAKGVVARSTSPILNLARQLVAAGYPDCPLEAYRGDVLCLLIGSIHEAVALEENSVGTGFIAAHKLRARPLVARRAKNNRQHGAP